MASLVENNYDEYGEILIYRVDFSQWQNYQQYINMTRAVSPAQRFFIVFFILTSIGLAVYARYLNRKLSYRAPFSYSDKQVNYMESYTTGGSRTNSGILMMRSRSGQHEDATMTTGDSQGDTWATGTLTGTAATTTVVTAARSQSISDPYVAMHDDPSGSLHG